jgi:hypothetical protein
MKRLLMAEQWDQFARRVFPPGTSEIYKIRALKFLFIRIRT